MKIDRPKVTQAVLLVGGLGTRLGELSHDTPKPLLPISGDKRFLDYVIEGMAKCGFSDILLIAGHLGALVAQRYHGAVIAGALIRVFVEPAPAGTGGALRHAALQLDDAFLMANGDSLFDFDYRDFAEKLAPKDVGILALRYIDDPRRYGLVVQKDERITSFREKAYQTSGAGMISGGVYCLRRTILDYILTLPCSIESDVFPLLASANRLGCSLYSGYFIDIGLPETLQQAKSELPVRWA